MEEDIQMAVGFDVEFADKSLASVSMTFRINADLRHGLAFDRVKVVKLEPIVSSFRKQLEKALKNPDGKLCAEESIDG